MPVVLKLLFPLHCCFISWIKASQYTNSSDFLMLFLEKTLLKNSKEAPCLCGLQGFILYKLAELVLFGLCISSRKKLLINPAFHQDLHLTCWSSRLHYDLCSLKEPLNWIFSTNCATKAGYTCIVDKPCSIHQNICKINLINYTFKSEA